MKKVIYLLLLSSVISLTGWAQAVLPTSFSFTDLNLPAGWSQSGTGAYSASGNTPPAMKFDGTGDYLLINVASNPGDITYYLAGNSFSGGTFLVQESVDGSTWTTLHTHTAPAAGSYDLYTDTPTSTSRFIRFFYSQKVTGNVGLDDVNIAVGAASSEQEINVKYNSSTIVTNGSIMASSAVGTPLALTFSVENVGTTTALNISSVNVSGAAASDFVVTTTPTTINGLSNSDLVVTFTPSVLGTRTGIITINSDDVDESAYVITINGTGGNLATEPTVQPASLTFSNVKTYRLSASFIPAVSVDGFLVLRSLAPITDMPVDGTAYMRGDYIGNAQVVSSGSSTAFTPNNIIANTTYYFAVFSYNGSNTQINYLTTAPLTGSQMTPATMMSPTEYNGISSSSSTFLADLTAHINPHNSEFYSYYGNYLIPFFESRDTTGNQRVVTCVYSGQNQVYTEPFGWTAQGFSREHSYCHQWMPSNPADSPERPEYDDYHHLFPTNQNNANALRSNYPLGVVVTPSTTYLDCKFGLDANGHNVFEPRDSHKGDAARAIMYAAACYNGIDGYNWKLKDPISLSIPYGQDQNVLKEWHFQDPPSNWEIARNDYIDSIQGNRNPFIDSVDYVCYINFLQMAYNATGCATGVLTLTCPANQTINSTSSTTVPNLTTTTTASSTCPGGSVTLTQSPAAGSSLNTGTNVITITASDCSNTQTCTVTIDYVNSIDENIQNSVRVYPVPAKEAVFLQVSGSDIIAYDVLDMQSRVIKSVKDVNASKVEVNTSSLKAGNYFVTIKTAYGNVVRKMVIE